jgi:hypothetical protein
MNTYMMTRLDNATLAVAENIVEGYNGGGNWKRFKGFAILEEESVSVVSQGFQRSVQTTGKVAGISCALIAANNLCWRAHGAFNEEAAEAWGEVYHNLRDKIFSDENEFSLTEQEISDIFTIID